MANAPAPPRDLTIDEFLESDDGKMFEYVCGEFRELNVSLEASETNGKFNMHLGAYVDAIGSGTIYLQDAGVRIWSDPKETLRADTLYVREEHRQPPGTTYLLVPPDLVVEVVSLHDTAWEVHAKVERWLEGGVSLFWVAYPFSQEIHVFRTGARTRILTADDELDGEDVLPGFRVAVARLFPRPIGTQQGQAKSSASE